MQKINNRLQTLS